MKKLPSNLADRPFSTAEAVAEGISKASLSRMAKAGILERLSRGVYRFGETDDSTGEDSYQMATLRCGWPSAICLLSAMEHYHVTDEIAKQIWVLVPAAKRIAAKDLKLIRSREPMWDIGIAKTKGYWITTLERTLIEGLLYKRRIGHQVAIAALKQSLAQRKVNLGQLVDMSNRMGVGHRIRPIIEVLGS
jgi:predicted transcriptional regulator of viral defense system